MVVEYDYHLHSLLPHHSPEVSHGSSRRKRSLSCDEPDLIFRGSPFQDAAEIFNWAQISFLMLIFTIACSFNQVVGKEHKYYRRIPRKKK